MPSVIHILLVEDSPTDALLLSEALADVSEFEHRLVRAETLAQAVEQVQKTRVDVVLLDLGLPDAQGVDTFRSFRRRSLDVPVVVLTGLDDISVGLVAIHEGAQDYLLKRDIHPWLLSRATRYAIERHRAARALAASEERFQLAVSGATAGLWDWNPHTGHMYLSPHFNEIMGYDEDELPNEAQALDGVIHPDDFDMVAGRLRAHLEHKAPYNVEYRVRAKSGEFRWIQSRGQAQWDEAGIAYRMVGWIMDVTDRKQDEEALRTSREELQRLSANIEHIREEEKARIARELHDDLGQLLTALKIEMGQLEHTLHGVLHEAAKTALSRVYALLDQLVGSVRRIAADLRPVMLDDLGPIPAIDWFVQQFSSRHRVKVRTRLDLNEVDFNRDSGTEVFRMVQEALTNIARHSGATEAQVEILREAPHCLIRIADNGRGVPHGARPGRNSFGLLGMRERAARLGGKIEVDTAPGQGFALRITLPLTVVEAPEAVAPDSGAAAS